MRCETCEGSGMVPEYHGQGMTEWLGCHDCHGTGAVDDDGPPELEDEQKWERR